MKQEKKLEEAKRLYKTANADQRYVLESLFPELKESKYEKNIKDLIDELKCSLRAANCQNEACNGGHEKRIALLEWAIAWLEKQGKQKPKKVSIWKHWKDGIAGNGEGEQTYLIKSGLRYSISSCLGYECDYIELSELDELLREEKQGKWSKEDEYHWMRCIKCLEWCSTPKGNDFYETVKWLESLKQRLEEQQ